VGPFEREAIRPHVTTASPTCAGRAAPSGHFAYLDKRSRSGRTRRRARRERINENLAREVLEPPRWA
jgi:uncharacterized protein (DUF1800 family)